MKNAKDLNSDERLVAVYGRVSTEHEAQISALENQMQYYDELVKSHSNWKLVETYIDEGLTATSDKKRPSFLKMIEDAYSGKFDLIITREVSRFARNTVDTLKYARDLKRENVEVFFIADNISTYDDDGELRLTIIAALAQNESRKISERVKAGQMISFHNGVIYGNGNILGYDRTAEGFVINPEQAKTVKMIFEMYASGMGVRKIEFELEKMGRLTATGKTNWESSNILRILNNRFYHGTIEYRKQFVSDFLEQKKRNNKGEVERVYTKGNYEPIISEELFNECQRILEKRSVSKGDRAYGRKEPVSVWVKKLKCSCCGGSFNRKLWHKNKDGSCQYAYQCYKQIRTGTIKTRQNKGLSTEGICNSPMIQEWKLELVGSLIIKRLQMDKGKILEYATNTLKECMNDKTFVEYQDKIDETDKEIAKIEDNIAKLLDLYMSDSIDKKTFQDRKKLLDKQIAYQEQKKNKLQSELSSILGNEDDLDKRIGYLEDILEKNFEEFDKKPPDSYYDALIHEIYVEGDNLYITLNGADESIVTTVPENSVKKKLRDNNIELHFSELEPGEANTEFSKLSEKQHRLQLQKKHN